MVVERVRRVFKFVELRKGHMDRDCLRRASIGQKFAIKRDMEGGFGEDAIKLKEK